jgi:hypothetical protein
MITPFDVVPKYVRKVNYQSQLAMCQAHQQLISQAPAPSSYNAMQYQEEEPIFFDPAPLSTSLHEEIHQERLTT